MLFEDTSKSKAKVKPPPKRRGLADEKSIMDILILIKKITAVKRVFFLCFLLASVLPMTAFLAF